MAHSIFTQLRNFIYQILYGFDKILNRKAEIIILCYHGFALDNWKYSVKKEEFVLQMSYLNKNFNFISLEDLYLYLSGKKDIKKPAVVITFDDGYKNLLSIRSIIKKYNIKPAILILSKPGNADFEELGKNVQFLSITDIINLNRDGWTLGCHSATHPDFWHLNPDEITREVYESKKTLESKLNRKVHFFAYPKGRYTHEVLKAVAKARYHLAFSMDDGRISLASNIFTLPRIGVDKTHDLTQFKATISPSVILFRSLIKRTPLIRLI